MGGTGGIGDSGGNIGDAGGVGRPRLVAEKESGLDVSSDPWSNFLSPGVLGALAADGLVPRALEMALRSTPDTAAERRWAWCRRPGPRPGGGPDEVLG